MSLQSYILKHSLYSKTAILDRFRQSSEIKEIEISEDHRKPVYKGTRDLSISDEYFIKELDEEEFYRESFGHYIFRKDPRFLEPFGYHEFSIINRDITHHKDFKFIPGNTVCFIELFIDIAIECYILNCCFMFHGDIKPDNIIFNNRYKLIDLCINSSRNIYPLSYSGLYCPLELLIMYYLDYKNNLKGFSKAEISEIKYFYIDRFFSKTYDVYALGMTILSLTADQFTCDSIKSKINIEYSGNIIKNISWKKEFLTPRLENIPEKYRELFKNCISLNPEERPSLENILQTFEVVYPERSEVLERIFTIRKGYNKDSSYEESFCSISEHFKEKYSISQKEAQKYARRLLGYLDGTSSADSGLPETDISWMDYYYTNYYIIHKNVS